MQFEGPVGGGGNFLRKGGGGGGGKKREIKKSNILSQHSNKIHLAPNIKTCQSIVGRYVTPYFSYFIMARLNGKFCNFFLYRNALSDI